MAKTTDPKSYAKNVLRSVGYITKETIKGVNPTLTSYITDTVSSTKDMYEHVKDFKRSFTGSMSDNTAFDDAKNIKNNIFDDIRSGKFYNPEREQKSLDAYMKSEGFSFDDFDMNDLDNEVEKDDNDNAPTRDVVERVGANIAISQQQMTAMSTEQITKGARSNTKASMAQNRQLFGMVNTSLASINGSILSLHNDLAQPLNNHITNSTTFFQFATGELAKQTSYLEKISKTLDERFAPSKGSGFKNRKTSAWEDIMSDGLPDLGKLVKNVKKRAWDDKGLGIISDFLNPEMLSMLSGTGGLSSPIATIATMALTSKLQNGATGKALNRTVDTMRSGFAHTAARISAYNASNWVETKNGKKNKNGFLGMLADLLDITPKKNNKMDFGNYEKGRVDWNGMDDKALREVIPTQLASILSAITGQEAKIFNYKTGKWESANKITKDFAKDRNKNISNAIYGFRDDVTKEFISNANAEVGRDAFSENSRATLSFKSDFDTLMQLIAMSGKNPATITAQELDKMALSGTNKWVGENRPGQKQYPINLANYKRIKAIIFKQGSMNRARFSGAVIDAQLADNRFIQESGQGSFAQVANGSGLKGAKKNSIAGTIFDAKDDYGHNVFYYLQSYWKQLDTIKHYVSTGNFGAVAEAERGNGAKSNKPYVSRLRRSRETATATSTTGIATPFVNITDEGATDIKTSKGEWKPVSEFAGSNKTERKREEASSPISRGIDKINNFMAKLFLGEGVSLKDSIAKEGGLKAWITSLPSKISTGIVSAFTGLKDKIKGWFSKHFTEEGELGTRTLKSAKDIFKGFGKSIASHAVNTAGDAVEWFKGQRPDWASSTTAYKGGMVRKSGMVSVSEGELIIPSQYNPFYKGISNKSAQKFTEARNYRNWVARGSKGGSYWGSYAEGSLSLKERKAKVDQYLSDEQKKNINKLISAKKTEKFISESLGIDLDILKDYIIFREIKQRALKTASQASKKAEDTASSVKDQFGRAKDKAKDTLTEAKDKLLGGVDRVTKALFGDEEKYAKAKDLGKSALDTIKADLPKTLASAGIGAIIGGALTGSGLGLLGGMVLGAGTMVIKNSDKINNFLFGSPDEDGNWSGGKIPPKMANFMKKRLPGMAKSGAIGGILGAVGLAPGGILGGLVIGAGVDLLAHNETVKNGISDALFGKEDVNGERNGGLFGLLKVRVVDPLANFVKEGTQKIGGYLKKNFLDPVVKIFDPLKDWAKGFGKNVGNKIANAFKSKVHRTITELADSTIGRGITALGGAAKGALGVVGNVASLPFKAVGKMGDSLAAHNVKAGYSSASAEKRAELGEKLGFFGKKSYEKSGLKAYNIAARDNVITEADYQNIDLLSRTKEQDQKALTDHNQAVRDKVVASLKFGGIGNPNDVKKITDFFNSDKANAGDYSEIEDYLKMNVSEQNRSNAKLLDVQQYLKESSDKFKKKQSSIDENEAKRQEFSKRTGIDLSSSRVRGQMAIDAKALVAKKEQEEKDAKAAKEKLDNILEENPVEKEQITIDRERNGILGSIKTIISAIASKIGIDINPNDLEKSEKESSDGNQNKFKLNSTKTGAEVPKEDKPPTEGETRTNPETGDEEEYRSGEWVPNLAHARTKERVTEEKERNGLQTKFYSTILGSGILAGLTGLLGKKDETGEKKETLWDKIKNAVFGDNGIFGSSGFLSKLFGGGSILATGLSTLTTLLPGIAAVAGAGAVGVATQKAQAGTSYDANMVGAAGDADGGAARAQASKDSANKGGFWNSVKTGFTGLQTLENTAKKKDVSSYKSEDAYISPYAVNRVTRKAIKNVITGQTITKGGKLLHKGLDATFTAAPKVAKAIGKGAQKVGSALSTAGTTVGRVLGDTVVGKAASAVANNSVVQKIIAPIKTVFSWLFKKLGVKGGEEIAEQASQEAGEQVAKKGGSALLKNIGTVIKIATIALAVEDGIEEGGAMTILGIVDTPTLTQRLLAGAINGINEAIPGIGGIIKTSTLFNIVYTVLEKLGFDFGDLAEQRAKAKEQLAAYQELHPGAELEEYIKNDPEEGGLGKRTTQDKIKRGVKNGFKSVVNAGKSFGEKVSNLGTSIKTGAASAKAWTSEKLTAAKDWTSGKINSVKDAVSGFSNVVKDKASTAKTWVQNKASSIGSKITNTGKAIGGKLTAAKDWTKDKLSSAVSTITSGVSAITGAIGSKITSGVDYIKEAKNAIQDLQTRVGATFNDPEKGMRDIESIEVNISDSNPLAGATRSVAGVTKIITTASLFVGAIGKKIYNSAIKPIIDTAKTTVKDTFNTVTSALKCAATGDFEGLYANESVSTDESNPIGFVSKIANIGAKVLLTPLTTVAWTGKKIKETFMKVVEIGKQWNASGANSLDAAKELMNTGSISELWNMNSNNNEEGFWGILSNIQDFIAKVAYTIPTAAIGVGRKIKEGFNAIKAAGTQFISSGLDSIETAKSHMMSGSLSDLWSMNSNENDEGIWGTISNVQDVAAKVAFSIPTVAVGIGGKIKETFEFIKGKVISCAKSIVSTNKSAKQFSSSGDLSGLWGINSNQDGENPLGFISNITDTLFKFAYTPSTVIKAARNKITEIFKNVKSSIPNVKSMITDLWSYTDPDKDISGYDTAMSKYKNEGSNDVYGTIGNVIATVLGGVMKPIISVVRIGKTIGESIGNIIGGVKEWVGDKVEGVKNWEYDKLDSLKSWALDDTGTGSGIHVSQRGNRKFGRSTIGANGCGPAAAATVLRAYGRNSDLDSAASFAEANGYVAGASGVGTRASYFSDIFGSNGIKSSYTQSKASMQGAISSGRPTVLLGQDRSNHSKANSPFGPNPHYVVARGTDSRGNIVVDDPELNKSALYKKDILKSARLGVMTGGDSGIQAAGYKASTAALGESSSAEAQTTKSGLPAASNNVEAVWGFFKGLGLSDGAVAGILGNMQQETGGTFNTEIVEQQFLNHLSGKSGGRWAQAGNIYSKYGVEVNDQKKAYTTYTQAINDKKISLDEFQHPYKMLNDPNYKSDKAKTGHEWLQYGYGLTQFTDPGIKKEIYDNTVAKGLSIGNLGGQLSTIANQLKSSGAWDTLSTTTSATDAAHAMLLKYEKPSENIELEKKKRATYASQFLSKYSGKNFDITNYKKNIPVTSTGVTDTGYTSASESAVSGGDTAFTSTSSTTSSDNFNLSSILSEVFGKVFKSVSSSVGGVAGKLLSLITGGIGYSADKTNSEDNTNTGTTTQGFTTSGETNAISGETANGFPLYLQADSKWGNIPYGSHGTIADAGCGPSSMAMVLKSYGVNASTTPEETAKWSASNGFRAENGTSWGFFKSIAAQRGLTVDEYGPGGGNPTAKSYQDKTKEYLSKGIPVIGSMRSGHFTTGGHFIVFSGIDDAGNIYVNDPSSKERSSHAWLPEQSLAQAKEFWAVKKPDGTGSLSKNISKTSPSTIGSRGGNSGLPLYDFTKGDVFKGGASALTPVDATGISRNNDQNAQLAQILLYTKQIASNTGFNASIPTIVEVLRTYGDVLTQMNAGGSASTAVNNQKSDTTNTIQTDISSMMAKLDAIASTL